MSKLLSAIPPLRRLPRNTLWIIAAAVLLAVIAALSPVQLPVAIYKASLISLAAVLCYWLDRALFPYARPDGYLVRDWRRGSDEPEGDVDYSIVGKYRWVFAACILRWGCDRDRFDADRLALRAGRAGDARQRHRLHARAR